MNKVLPIIYLVWICALTLPVKADTGVCQRLHSCPADDHSYQCGDMGFCSGCPDNDFCRDGKYIGERVELGPGYSLELAKNWRVAKRGSLQHKLVFTEKRNDFEPSLGLDTTRPSDISLEDYVVLMMQAIQRSFTEFSEDPPTPFSAKNMQGYRVTASYVDHSGRKVRALQYFFESAKKEKLVFTGRVAHETGRQLDPVFDQMVGTFVAE